MKIIRTVLGDVPADKAGITLTHEHILYAYPGADLDHRTVFDFDEIAGRIAKDLRLGLEHYGIATLVEMTPAEVYRHPALMRGSRRGQWGQHHRHHWFLPSVDGSALLLEAPDDRGDHELFHSRSHRRHDVRGQADRHLCGSAQDRYRR